MLDIVISFFENVSPEFMVTPFMFLKAEMSDGYIPPPGNDEVVRQIKSKKHDNRGEPVQVQNWDNAKRMLANAPLEHLMQVRDDVDIGCAPDKRGFLASFFSKPNNNLEIARIRLLTIQPAFVRLLSGNLSHRPSSDVGRINEWGLDVEHALGRFLNKSLERVRVNGYHQKNHASQPVQALKDTLSTRQINAVRKSLIKMRLGAPFIMQPIKQETIDKLNLKVMDFDTRMTHALDVLSRLEESCKDDISDGKGRIRRYEETQETISKFYELLETYHDTMQSEAPRIKREEAEAFQNGGDLSDKLRAKFKDMSLTAKEDIAERLHGLRTTMHVCEIEYGAYQSMIEAEKNSWDAINHLTRVQIPMFRQQLMQAQNIKAGRVAVDMDTLSAKLHNLSGQKLRDAAANEIIDGVCVELKQASETLDNIADTEIKAITKAQTLMIADQRPVALIENKMDIALEAQ